MVVELKTAGNVPPKVGDSSPWERIQHVTEIGPGIVRVHTAGHGGIWVADCLMPFLSTEAKAYARKFTNSQQWFEEDCAWAYVAIAFPDHFPDEEVQTAAKKTIEWVREYNKPK